LDFQAFLSKWSSKTPKKLQKKEEVHVETNLQKNQKNPCHSFLIFMFWDVSLHEELKNTQNNCRKNHKKSKKKVPTHLRGRFFSFSAP
jgi:hypothetical protein